MLCTVKYKKFFLFLCTFIVLFSVWMLLILDATKIEEKKFTLMAMVVLTFFFDYEGNENGSFIRMKKIKIKS